MTAEEVLQRVERRAGGTDPQWALRAIDQKLAHFLPVGRRSGIVGYIKADGTAVLYAVAGNLSELLGCLPQLAAWYRRAGAERMWATGREGWRRLLERRGWRVEGDGMVKDLR